MRWGVGSFSDLNHIPSISLVLGYVCICCFFVGPKSTACFTYFSFSLAFFFAWLPYVRCLGVFFPFYISLV